MLLSLPLQLLTGLSQTFLVYAIFAGGLAGLFLLGMLSRRANARGVAVGIVVSLAVSVYLTCSHFGWLVPEAVRSPTHPYLIGALGNSAMLAVGYLASLLFRSTRTGGELDGLTAWRR